MTGSNENGASSRSGPAPFRDVAAFHERSADYDSGWRGDMHHRISDGVARLALDAAPTAGAVLDVGCGTGYLLRALAAALPRADRFVGVDPAPGMIEVATHSTDDPRITFAVSTAERLGFDHLFDLIVSSTSFDHWTDQGAGLDACAAALRPGGTLVLCDQFSTLLLPTLVGTRRGKARTRGRATALLLASGFGDVRWHRVYTSLIGAAVATVK